MVDNFCNLLTLNLKERGGGFKKLKFFLQYQYKMHIYLSLYVFFFNLKISFR